MVINIRWFLLLLKDSFRRKSLLRFDIYIAIYFKMYFKLENIYFPQKMRFIKRQSHYSLNRIHTLILGSKYRNTFYISANICGIFMPSFCSMLIFLYTISNIRYKAQDMGDQLQWLCFRFVTIQKCADFT